MLNKELLLCGLHKPLITFKYINSSIEFRAEEGMTWLEFVNSQYNIKDLDNLDGYYHRFNYENNIYWHQYTPTDKLANRGHAVILEIGKYPDEATYIKGTDKIIAGHTYGYPVCYAQGTLLTLSNGKHKKIEDVSYDDDLLVWDFDAGCFSKAKPSWISKPQLSSSYFKVTLGDGTVLKLIGSNGDCHRLFNVEQSKFVYGSRFNLGERTFKEDKSTPKVVSIELVHEDVVYYNLITKYHLNCFINGVLSSCRYNNLYPIKDMKFVKSNRKIVPFKIYGSVSLDYYNDLRLGEVDTGEFSIEKTKAYVNRLIKLRAP